MISSSKKEKASFTASILVLSLAKDSKSFLSFNSLSQYPNSRLYSFPASNVAFSLSNTVIIFFDFSILLK